MHRITSHFFNRHYRIINIVILSIIMFLYCSEFYGDDNPIRRAQRYMSIHNERSYHRAEKLLSSLQIKTVNGNVIYLRVKNLLNWAKYYGRSKSLLMRRLISLADSLIALGKENYPAEKDNLLLLHALSEGLKGNRHVAQTVLQRLKDKFGSNSYYKYLVWKFSGYRPDPLDDTLDDLIRQNPQFFKARFDRARWYFNLGIIHLATEEARILMAMKPRSPWVLTFYGVCLLEHNDPGNAQAYFRRALSIENYSPAVFELGRSLYLYGKLVESIPFFIKTLILDPAHLGANYYIGKAYMIQGNRSKAAYHLKKYITLNPNGIDREDVEKWIERLEANRRT